MRNRFILLLDILLIGVAAYGAFALRFDWLFYSYRTEFWIFVAVAAVAKPAVFHGFGLYQRFWRYASIDDMMAVILAVSASSVLLTILVAVGHWARPQVEFSRAVLLIDWLLTGLVAGGLRMSVRVVGEARKKGGEAEARRDQKRVLIVGAGDAGTMVLREIQRNPQLGLAPVGVLDDEPRKIGKLIYGVRVLGALPMLASAIRTKLAEEVIIAMPTAPGTVLRAIAVQCQELGVASRTIPGVFELIDGQVSVSRLRHIEISDLLRRAPVQGEPETREYLGGQVVLVTGAGGSIGFELCRQAAAARPARLVLLGHGENSLFDARNEIAEKFPGITHDVVVADIQDAARLRQVFERVRPTVVFHAAAHKHVPLMEENPGEAIFNNILGTKNVIDAAIAVRAQRLVMISTDKAVAPSSIMGATKRVSETIVRDAARRHGMAFAVVRFGNVLGSRGSVVPFFKRQIERGGPVTITHPEMRRFFMTIPEAVHLVLQAGSLSVGGELFVLDMGQPVRIVDLVEDMITLSGARREQVAIRFTGTRAGEKLSEELWEEGARVEATSHPKIRCVVEPELCPAESVIDLINAVAAAGRTGDRLTIEAELARWIPSYVPVSASHDMPRDSSKVSEP